MSKMKSSSEGAESEPEEPVQAEGSPSRESHLEEEENSDEQRSEPSNESDQIAGDEDQGSETDSSTDGTESNPKPEQQIAESDRKNSLEYACLKGADNEGCKMDGSASPMDPPTISEGSGHGCIRNVSESHPEGQDL